MRFFLPDSSGAAVEGLAIAFLQRGQADEASLIFPFDGNMLSAFYLIIQCPQLLQKCFKGLRLLLQNSIDILAENISVFHSARVVCSFCTLPVWLRSNNRKAVFQADQITDSLQGNAGQPEVFELSGSVNGSGIEDNVVMNMSPIGMSCYDKGIALSNYIPILIYRCCNPI